MKKINFVLSHILLLLISGQIISQGPVQVFSSGGTFEKVYDRFGNQYSLSDINLMSAKPIGGTSSVNAVPSQSCIGGYFRLFFGPGTFFDNNLTAQNTLCQLFTDISNFVKSPLSSNGGLVNIYCGNTPTGSNAAGVGSSIFLFPNNPTNPNQGIIDNQVYKTIISGVDSYSNFPISVFSGASNFYHGYLDANPNLNWNLTYSTTTINPGENDFYTIMLHEATHLLGFYSMIGSNGTSLLGSANNYYSRYDKFLTNYSFAPLLTTTSSCSFSGLMFSGSPTQINQGNCINTGSPLDNTNCSIAAYYAGNSYTSAVYTPTCYENGSSLSHFEDQCTHPTGTTSCTGPSANWNNLYFVMSNMGNTGSCFMKRYLKEEERSVLCDMGYSVAPTYSCSGANAKIDGSSNLHNYSSGFCQGPNIWGLNDGLLNSNFTFTAIATVTNAISIPITASITNNDALTTVSISCLDVIYNNASATISGGNLIVSTATNFTGLVIIKYLPRDANGKYGSPTYIFSYFIGDACSPPNSCDLIQNGGFENNHGLASCGIMFPNPNPLSSQPILDCWEANSGSPDYFVAGCNSSLYNLGTLTYPVIPAMNTYNGASGNNAIIGMFGSVNNSVLITEEMKTNLSSPLTNGQPYLLDLWVNNIANPSVISFTPLPIVLSVNSLPNFAFFGTPNILANFTINPTSVWTHLTYTFVFNSLINHNALSIGINPILTGSLNSLGTNPTSIYFFIDDVSIKPLPTPTFVIPNASACGNTTFTNLAQYASPIPGVFTGTGVTTVTNGTLTQYNFSPPGPGTYPVAFNYTNTGGCTGTVWQSIVVSPTVNISVSGSTIVCSNASSNITTLTASSSCATCTNNFYYWQPGYLVGPTHTFTPGTYTVIVNSGSCTASKTVAVNVSTTCCSNTISTFLGSDLPPQLNGTKAINNTVLVPTGSTAVLAGEFLFAPNVKIIVNGGANLIVKDAHLYACGNTMWQGIEVRDGGSFTSVHETKDNLIEDAQIAIDVTGHTTSTVTNILNISNTTFNKNYISINISNYQRSNTSYPFVIKSNVFTCRDFSFTTSTWPQTGTASPTSDLRFATSSPTDLAAPYLGQVSYSVTPLKNPYSGQYSQTAIQLNNVGLTNFGTPYAITIGEGSSPANFNLFDSHGKGIDATNSNVKSYNNTFQKSLLISGVPGIGLRSINNSTNPGLLETYLDLVSPSTPSLNFNRFFDCHTGVNTANIATVNIQYAEFKSMQSNTVTSTANDRGQFGIFITGNRFASYAIKYNSFYNVSTGLYGGTMPGIINPWSSPQVYGQQWGTFVVSNNLFSPSTTTASGNSFVRCGVILENILSTRGYLGSTLGAGIVTISPMNGLRVQYNTFDKVYSGILVRNFSNSAFGKFSANNTIILKQDHVTSNPQWGVKHENDYFGIVNTNTITGFTTVITTTLSGVYVSMNTTGSAQCNSITNVPKCMEFAGNNSLVWKNNNMNNASRGMQLSSNGIIGAQGTFTAPMDNYWQGSSWTNPNVHTYASNSTPNLSILTKRTLPAVYNPTLNSGNPFSYSVGVSLLNGSNSATFVPCVPPILPNKGANSVKLPLAKAVASNTMTYVGLYPTETSEINRFLLYQDLEEDSAFMASDVTLQSFYTTNQTGGIGTLLHIGQLLSEGNLSSASSALSAFTESTTIQGNYKSFYSLYLKYIDPNIGLNASDKITLLVLAQKCPFIDGPIIYNARALNTLVRGEIIAYNDDGCDSQSLSLMGESGGELSRKASQPAPLNETSGADTYQLFPNPATDVLNVFSSREKEEILVEIRDTGNKLLFNSLLAISNYRGTLKLDLLNGIYFVTLIKSKHERLTKKLVISK